MNLCRCEQGHFYDKEKYASCPHCAGGSAFDDKRTEAFTEDFTVPSGGGGMGAAPAEQQMAPVNQVMPPISQAVPPAAQPLPPIPPVVPAGNGMPVAGLSANQMTVAVNTMAADDATIPLEEAVSVPEADDDHTVGFFDDVFLSAAGETSSAGSAKTTAAAPAANPVNKVKTPCVGWLLALGGEHIGTDFRLKVGKNFIGRSPKMDVALTEDKSVSRESHAIVVYEPKAHLYLVQPGESSSLVYRNNEVVLTPMKLEAYDMITVGDINLLFIPLCGERFNWGDLLEEMKKKNR